MYFHLTSSRRYYDTAEKQVLETLGFQFAPATGRYQGGWRKIHEEGTVDLTTLDELLAFQQRLGYAIILEAQTLTIYDGYRE